MKRIILTALIVMSTTLISVRAEDNSRSQGQSSTIHRNRERIDEFFDHYRALESVTIIEIAPAMTKLLASNIKDNNDVAQLLRSIESISIMVDPDINSEIRERMLSLPLDCEDYELITSIKSGQEQSFFYFASHKDSDNCEFMMLVTDEDSQMILSVIGVFTINDISKLTQLSKL